MAKMYLERKEVSMQKDVKKALDALTKYMDERRKFGTHDTEPQCRLGELCDAALAGRPFSWQGNHWEIFSTGKYELASKPVIEKLNRLGQELYRQINAHTSSTLREDLARDPYCIRIDAEGHGAGYHKVDPGTKQYMVHFVTPGKRRVLAHLAGTVERNFVRLVPGDRVEVVLAPDDPTRGRIVKRL